MSLLVPLTLALAVWTVPLLDYLHPQDHVRTDPRIRTSTATELRAEIASAPRAVVYVDCEVSVPAVRGRLHFTDAAAGLGRDAPKLGLRFFVIQEETRDDSQVWVQSLGDDRLVAFGHLGNGWLIWLELGRVVAVESHGGHLRSPAEMARLIRTVWPE